MVLEENKLLKSVVKDDQFILLGPQDKFSSVNLVPYRLRVPVNNSISRSINKTNIVEPVPDNKPNITVPDLEINKEKKLKPASKTVKTAKDKTQVIKKVK